MRKLSPKEFKLYRYLKDQPRARERINKNRSLVNFLSNEYGWLMRGLGEGTLTKETMTNFVEDILYFDRKWRKLLEEFPELQGNDYNTKKKYEQKAKIDNGYQVGHYQDLKKLNTLL